MKARRWRELVLSGRVVCLLWVFTSACKHLPSEQELQGALHEFQIALEMDPNLAEAHYAIGTLLHLSFGRREQAIEHFDKALAIRPNYSEAKANLANVYLDLGQYDRAIALYREALNDMLYPTPYIAQGNLGWALYKKGDTRGAL